MTKRISDELIDEMYKLHCDGKNFKEISKIVGVNPDTISLKLKQRYNVSKTINVELDVEEITELVNSGLTQVEIAEKLNVTKNQVAYFVSKHKIRKKLFSDKKLSLTEIQEQMIFGSLLGDLYIGVSSKRSKNARIAIVHSEDQKELFMEKVKILDKFMGSYKLYNTTKDKRTGKIYPTYRGNSKAHPEFTKIHNLVYINGEKQISDKFLNKVNHPIALAYWFMDDGTNRGTLATNSFSEEEITRLINFLKNKFNINSTRQKNQENEVIHISESSRLDFERLIFPYVLPSMYYKLKYIDILELSV